MLLCQAEAYAQHGSYRRPQTADQESFADEDRTNELRTGAQGPQRGHIVPFLDHQHHEGPDYRERGEHQDQQRNEENAPFLVGNQSEEEGVHLVAGAHREIVADDSGDFTPDLFRVRTVGYAHRDRRYASRTIEKFLGCTQGGKCVFILAFQIEKEESSDVEPPHRISIDGKQRRETAAPQGIDGDFGTDQRPDSGRAGHVASQHQSVEIARANAPTAQRDRFLDREHFCITVVHASQRGHRLQTVPFEQNLLFEQVRNDPDPFHAGQRQTVDFRRCEGLPFTGGNGQIGIEGRRHGLGEISETVQHGQQHDHRRNGHGERKNAHTRNNVDHRTGFR